MAVWTGYKNRKTPVLDSGLYVATDVYRNMMLYLYETTGSGGTDWTMPDGLYRSGSYVYQYGSRNSYTYNYSSSSSSSSLEASSSSSSVEQSTTEATEAEETVDEEEEDASEETEVESSE